MPRFTLISEDNGTTVTVSFETDFLAEASAQTERFLEASGFVLPEEEVEEDSFERRLTEKDFLAKEEDYLWSDSDYSTSTAAKGNVLQFNSQSR